MLNQIAQWLVKPVGALDRAHSILVNVQTPRQHSWLRTSHAWPPCIQHRTATSGCSLLLCLIYILAVFSSCWPSAHQLRSCSAEQSTADVAGCAAVGRSSIRLRPAARQRPPASRPPSPAAAAPPARKGRAASALLPHAALCPTHATLLLHRSGAAQTLRAQGLADPSARPASGGQGISRALT